MAQNSPREKEDDEERAKPQRTEKKQNWTWKSQVWRRSMTTEECWTCDVTVGN